MAFEKSRSAGYLINHLARIFAQALAREIRPMGLVPGQFMVLLELWREDGLTQRDLVARLDVEQATLANTLARMERDGLVTRVPHPTDGRAQLVRITALARRLEAPATAAADQVNRRLLAALPDGDRQGFVSAMQAVIAASRETN
jgi:DNA-binding MarR family transcriptional regulator